MVIKHYDCALSVHVSHPYVRAGWVDCWSVPNFLLIIDYTWHPIYPQKADEQLKQSRKLTAQHEFFKICHHVLAWCLFIFIPSVGLFPPVSEMEESMLSALRPPEHTSAAHSVPPRFTSTSASAAHSRATTDPSELPPDRLHVEMEMSPDSQIILYGPLLRALISIKVLKLFSNNNNTLLSSYWLLCDHGTNLIIYTYTHLPLFFSHRRTILGRMTCTQTSRKP